MKAPFTILPVALLLSALSCSPGEQVIRVQYLKTECGYCKMIFQDRAFGAEMQLENDSLLVFDAMECLSAYMISNSLRPARVKRIWSVDYNRPTMLLDAREAVYMRSDKLLSPMGVNIAAFGSKAEADSAYTRIGGDRMDWPEVVSLVRRLWFHSRADPDSLR
jgi:copper chaperone NosL